jgi:dephospho-CoA kinase
MAFVVALTGGIGSGKSSAAELFAGLGAEIVDTDDIAHQVTAPGEPVLTRIAREFGSDVLTAQGALDRARLRERVFVSADRRKQLESIVHPLIRAEVESRLQRTIGPYVVLVVPLLVETGAYSTLVNRVLVIDAPQRLRTARVMRRSRLRRKEVESILRAQASRAQRLAKADDVLTNAGSLQALRSQVAALHKKYLALATGTR